jgi:hypothetical protein
VPEKPSLGKSFGWYVLFFFVMHFVVATYFHMVLGVKDGDAIGYSITYLFLPLLVASPLGAGLIHGFRYLMWIDEEKAEEAKTRLRRLSERSVAKLQHLDGEIKALAKQLQISFPVDHLTQHTKEVQKVIDTYGTRLLTDSAPLDNVIRKLTQKAEEDKKQLRKANDLNQTALRVYTNTSRQINRIGSMPLIKELEYTYARLIHRELKSLLSQRRWIGFHDVVSSIIEDLRRLQDLAVKYEQHEEEYEEFEEPSIIETDEEKAYRILGIPPTVTDAQIKKLYKKLASVYHPDAGVITDGERFKEINWSYEVLKAARHMS